MSNLRRFYERLVAVLARYHRRIVRWGLLRYLVRCLGPTVAKGYLGAYHPTDDTAMLLANLIGCDQTPFVQRTSHLGRSPLFCLCAELGLTVLRLSKSL